MTLFRDIAGSVTKRCTPLDLWRMHRSLALFSTIAGSLGCLQVMFALFGSPNSASLKAGAALAVVMFMLWHTTRFLSALALSEAIARWNRSES